MLSWHRIEKGVTMRRFAFLLPLALVAALAHGEGDEGAFELLRSISEQMAQIQSIRAEYEVVLGGRESGTRRTLQVTYVQDGERFSETDNWIDNSGQPRARRMSYNGTVVRTIDDFDGMQYPLGHVEPADQHGYWKTGNGFLDICGLPQFAPDFREKRPEIVFKSLDDEEVDGRTCKKVLSVEPYFPGQKAYTYNWVDTRGQEPHLLKTECLIDDDPGKKLVERRYKYDSSVERFLPSEIWYLRNQVDRDGKVTPEYIKEVSVRRIETNAAIGGGEFDLVFPTGTQVYDAVLKITYTAGQKTLTAGREGLNSIPSAIESGLVGDATETSSAEGRTAEVGVTDSRVTAQEAAPLESAAQNAKSKGLGRNGAFMLGLAIAVVVAWAIVRGMRSRRGSA
jgi:hypothetical protein